MCAPFIDEGLRYFQFIDPEPFSPEGNACDVDQNANTALWMNRDASRLWALKSVFVRLGDYLYDQTSIPFMGIPQVSVAGNVPEHVMDWLVDLEWIQEDPSFVPRPLPSGAILKRYKIYYRGIWVDFQCIRGQNHPSYHLMKGREKSSMRVFRLQTKEQDILRQCPEATNAELLQHMDEDVRIWRAAFVDILNKLKIRNDDGWIEEADDGESLRRLRHVDWHIKKVKDIHMRLRELVGQKLFIQMHKDTAVCYHTDESIVERITKWRLELKDHPNRFQELLCTEGFVRGISTEQGHILLGKLLEAYGPANIVQLASTGSLIHALMDDAHMKKVNGLLYTSPSPRDS